ncbi:MAG: ABC transporter permease [Gemmatimonadota bacterium]|nr:MAG: ABC transporter permease [Gemmatimonadota bacterium]
MVRFVARRLLQGVAVVFLVATLAFILFRLAPGDPFTRMGDASSASQEFKAQARRNLGLDQPLHTQYFRYIANLARGDLGMSFSEQRPVLRAIADRVPATVVLAAAALLIDFLLGIFIGAAQGSRAGSKADDLLSVLTLTLYSVPVFWLGLMLMLVFAHNVGLLDLLPATGSKTTGVYEYLTPLGQLTDRIRHLILPAVALGLVGAAGTARYQRAAMLDVIRQDFIRTARAKGLRERSVLLGHALRNSLLPIITLFGLSFPILLSGTVLVETVFAWPGLGKFVVDAIFARDYNVVTGAVIISACMVVLGNLLADLLYRAVDPRVRGVV